MNRLDSFKNLKHMLQIVDHNAKTTDFASLADLALTSLINQHYISALSDEVDRAKDYQDALEKTIEELQNR